MGVGAVIAASMVNPNLFAKPFYVVSTQNGYYVARLSYPAFSSFVALRDAHTLNDVKNDKNEIVDQQLVPIGDNAIWAPKIIYLNKDQIIFKGKVGECSLIDRALDKAFKVDNDCPDLQPAPTPMPAPAQ